MMEQKMRWQHQQDKEGQKLNMASNEPMRKRMITFWIQCNERR